MDTVFINGTYSPFPARHTVHLSANNMGSERSMHPFHAIYFAVSETMDAVSHDAARYLGQRDEMHERLLLSFVKSCKCMQGHAANLDQW